ncbi:hypothetical protein CDN99_25300 [Roseateles aquatilis]|uniref:Anti-sigma K factor RskA C-terminal domain-containing protein n=1 Tax=Roseateles aquatilis TaxID=431061 RepID=A0A246IU84_9BURK|nr:anti-sigma factor [Roseateles aquatilis]OWQ83788.1 hypothetical protein CDN99_25300 [Roseateles aquatilis]
MNYERPELIEHLAREYVLGTLQGPARRRFKGLAARSPRIAAAVASWEARLAVMEQAPVLIPPPMSTWRGIEQRLFPSPSPAAARRTLGAALRWLGARAAGGVLAGLLVAVVVVKSTPSSLGLEVASEALPASYVGVLTGPGDKPSVVVSSRRHGKQLSVKVLAPIPVPQGSVATLWAIPKTGEPWAIGTVAPSGKTQIGLPAESEQLFANVSRLAISLEEGAGPRPASPSAYVLQGACVKVW